MSHRVRLLVLPLAALAAACGDAAPTESAAPSPSASLGSVDGTVESTVTPSGRSAGTIAPSLHRASASTAGAAGMTVAFARVASDGALQVLRTAAVAADGSYRIDSVPAGVDRGVVLLRTSAGAEAGRVIVHQAVAAGQTTPAAPIDGETTVEAHVYAEVVRGGLAPAAVNTVELARGIATAGPAAARALLASAPDLRALADGARARQDAYTAVLATRGVTLDAAQRFQAQLPAVVAFAQARRAGAADAEAGARADSAIAALLRARGVSDAAQVEAQGAAEAGLLRALATASAQARLDVARAAVQSGLVARARVIDSALRVLALRPAAADSIRARIAAARAIADTASSPAVIRGALAAAADGVQGIVARELSSDTRIPALAQQRIAAAFAALPTQTTLEARLAAAVSAGAVASAHAAFAVELRAAVQAAVATALGAGSAVDGRAIADIIVALRSAAQPS